MQKLTAVGAVARGLTFVVLLESFWHYFKSPIIVFLQNTTSLVPPLQGRLIPDRSIVGSDLIDTCVAALLAYILIAIETRFTQGRFPSIRQLATRTNLSGGINQLLCLACGAALGLAAASSLIIVLHLIGAEDIYFASIITWNATVEFFKLFIVFAVIGVGEEFWFRGYAQRALTDGGGFWTASITTSVWFAWNHYENGDPLIGAVHALLDGFLWCLTLKVTGNLAFAMGYHSAWDFTQSAIFGVPDSTLMYKGHLGLSLANGPDWITGGIVGPEGSVLSFIQLGGLIPIALWYCIRTKQTSVMSVALPRH